MKMKVFMKRINGNIIRKTVTATDMFYMYGYNFAVHGFIDEYGKIRRDKFTVSEMTTGFHISDGRTKAKAIEYAQQRLKDHGKRRTISAMKRAMDDLTI